MQIKYFSTKFITILLCSTLVFNGCTTSGGKYSGAQKQQLETNVIDGSYNNVFNATRTVFLNSGLVLQQVDKESGFVRGVLSVKKKNYWSFSLFLLGLFGLLIFFMNKSKFFGQQDFEITATIIDLSNNAVEVRLQTPLLEKQSEDYGVALKRIFAEIKKQVLILEAAGRS